jgi:hypothetical protein
MIWRIRISIARALFVLAMAVAPSRGAGGVFISDDGESQNSRRQFKKLNKGAIAWALDLEPK